MGRNIELSAADGHKFSAYVAEPSGKPKGALIVVMEIFGVNSHTPLRYAQDERKDEAPQSKSSPRTAESKPALSLSKGAQHERVKLSPP